MYNQVYIKRVGYVRKGTTPQGSLGGGNYNNSSIGSYASSVYAGAGGLGTKISSSHGGFASFNFKHNTSEFLLRGNNEKETMQNLNSRLESYLERVHSLEKANSELEVQIREWYSKNAPGKRDDSKQFQTIEDLKQKVYKAINHNAIIVLEMDNARLAADDFKMKFENEQILRSTVENDIVELRKMIDQLTIAKADLENQIETLSEQKHYLKKNHSEEMDELHKQTAGAIDVQVNATPSVDLGKIMEDMRQQYQQLAEKQRLEAKYIFDKKVEEWNLKISTDTTELEQCKRKEKDLKRKAQELEIQLQTEISMGKSVSATIETISTQYSIQLAEIQERISALEGFLQQERSGISHQVYEYEILFDLKSRLEAEIATYKRLLDGEE
ncbi:keratin, type I cytoskeletal 19 [Bombina bombina]|uniref:keratin, type I cytoskeletal 19 n=1 Tax=Bombina bombina TaxID=8345 RepID=UPI00235A8E5D|nr:keratin, type I cytoskeletal 19 [Bombina bombina]